MPLEKAKGTEMRVLNDYLHNLLHKYQLENPEIQMPRSTFCALGPPTRILTHFSSRKTCICTLHQNFAPKIKSMKNEGLQCSKTLVFL